MTHWEKEKKITFLNLQESLQLAFGLAFMV
jgi:hypothetical protein